MSDILDECWVWKGAFSRGGYGQKYVDGRLRKTHRLAWAWANWDGTGKWWERTPRELFVLHHCDNPPCCNPEHLALGTHDDNMRDMVRRRRGQKPSCRHGHIRTESNTEVTFTKSGRRRRRCRICKRANDKKQAHKRSARS